MRSSHTVAVCAVFLSIVVSGASVLTAAAEPVDTLRRRSPEVGSVEYTLSASYQPGSAESVLITPDGPVLERMATHDIGVELTLVYKASVSLTVDMARGWNERVSLVERSVVSGHGKSAEPDVTRDSRNPITAWGLSFKPWPDHRLEPTLRLQVVGGGATTLGLSVSSIADPTVLSTHVGVARNDDGTSALDLSLGAGFVANDRVHIGASVSHRTAPGTVAVPATVFGVRVGYSLDARAGKEVGVTSSLRLTGGAARAGFGLYWQGEILSW